MSVREKTRRHLERLAAAAAVASAVGAAEACKNGGSAVVDPMPPPSRCPGAAASLKMTASWIDTPKGRRVEVLIDAPNGAFKLGDPSKVTSYSGDVIDEATATPTGLRAVVEPKYPPYGNLVVPVACIDRWDAGADEVVQVGLDFADGGGAIKVSASEY